jgi:hypothetical protein
VVKAEIGSHKLTPDIAWALGHQRVLYEWRHKCAPAATTNSGLCAERKRGLNEYTANFREQWLRGASHIQNWTRDSKKVMALPCLYEERPLNMFWKNQ